MTGIKIITDSLCLKHKSGFDHPEKPSRINTVLSAYKNSPSLIKEMNLNTNDLLSDRSLFNTISGVHNKNLLGQLESSSKKKATFFNFDCIANKFTYISALSSCKLAITASELSNPSESYFALIRPPGHHASSSEMMGFCYLNNIAIAASYQVSLGKKVAIIDFDYHYGNGTADIFWENPNVLYISVHADPAINYPNSGFINEIGEKDGSGYNICIPFSFGSGNNELIYSINNLVIPLLDEFHPDIIGISAGFDGYYDDPVGLGFLKYSNKGYKAIGNILFDYSMINKTPIFHTLEGGYNIAHMPKLIDSFIKPWINYSRNIKRTGKPKLNDPKSKIKKKEKETIKVIKKIVSPYWSL